MLVTIFRTFAKVQYRFELLKANLNLIASAKNFVYELPQEILKHLKPETLENYGISVKISKLGGDISHAHPSLQK